MILSDEADGPTQVLFPIVLLNQQVLSPSATTPLTANLMISGEIRHSIDAIRLQVY